MEQGFLTPWQMLQQDAQDEGAAQPKPKRKRRRAHKGFTNNRRTRQIRGRGRR